MRQDRIINVFYHDRLVGTLAMTNERKAAFEYADEWLENGFSISPFSLPLEKKVYVPVKDYFNGLWGVFADSLPDAWGQLLLDRMLKEKGHNIDNVSMLDRLAIVGESGMGALTYRPEWDMPKQEKLSSLDELSEQCQRILNTEYSDKLDELYRLGGTSGGARPKIMTKIDGEDWIIKFPAHVDGKNAGLMEYQYSQCAKQCGIDMEETRLFPSDICDGYFGTKRFDRKNGEKLFSQTLAAIMPGADDYMKLCWIAETLKLPQEDKDQIFIRMVFNYVAGISDDHNKNISFIMDKAGVWRLSPAYDVMFTANTWENSSAHIHSMGVMGKRSALTTSDFVNFAEDFVEEPEKKILQVFDAVSKFQSLCATYGIDKAIFDKIQHVLDGLVTDDLDLLQLT